MNSPHSRSTFTWYGTGSNSQLDRLDENEAYVTPSWKGDRPVVNGDMRYEYDREGLTPVDPSWYQDPPDNDVDPSSSQSGHIIKDHVTRCHSQDSGVLHRIVGIHSMSSDDGSHSQPMRAEDLGVVKISRRNKKSLEMLTRYYYPLPPSIPPSLYTPSLPPSLPQFINYISTSWNAKDS